MGRGAKAKSCTGGAALGKNREGRTHRTADGALGNAREMFGKDATVEEFSGVPGPGHSQAPGLVEFLGAGSSNLADGDLQETLEAPIENENAFDADEELPGSRRRASLLIAPPIDNNQSCQFSGLVVGVGAQLGGRQKNGGDEHGQTDDGRNEASPQAQRQDHQRRPGDSQENAEKHPKARGVSPPQDIEDKQHQDEQRSSCPI